MGVDLFSDLQPRITKDDEEATNNIITWLDNLSKTTLMGPVPKYIVFKGKKRIFLQTVFFLKPLAGKQYGDIYYQAVGKFSNLPAGSLRNLQKSVCRWFSFSQTA